MVVLATGLGLRPDDAKELMIKLAASGEDTFH
jgi:phage terminase small subunit